MFPTGFLCLLGLLAAGGCGHAPAVGRGGPVYEVTVESINGRKTAPTGSISHPACTIQVGDQVAQVWLADPARGEDVTSPSLLRGDAAALKDGILIERSWSQALVHKVTDEELSVGAAVVYLPGTPHPTVVELRFVAVSGGGPISFGRRDPRRHSRNRQHDLSKRGPGF